MIAEVDTGLVVAATLLGERPYRFETVLDDSDCDLVSFFAPHQIILTTPAKLETGDGLWMGTVLTCHAEGNRWRVTMRVQHTLRNLSELLDLASRFE